MEENEVVTSEENTDQENTISEAEEGTKESSDSAEGKKISAILERKNKKIADLEAKLEEKGETKVKPKEVTVESPEIGLSREEAILYAKGLSEEEVDKVSKIAKIEGITRSEALAGDYFQSWKKTNEDKVKSEKASLGASNSSPKSKEKTSFDTKDISAEDHEALFRKRLSK